MRLTTPLPTQADATSNPTHGTQYANDLARLGELKMAKVTQTIRHEHYQAEITTVQRRPETGECIENWRFIDVEICGFERYTPKELRDLGQWLIDQGTRIGREYKCNGAKK